MLNLYAAWYFQKVLFLGRNFSSEVMPQFLIYDPQIVLSRETRYCNSVTFFLHCQIPQTHAGLSDIYRPRSFSEAGR